MVRPRLTAVLTSLVLALCVVPLHAQMQASGSIGWPGTWRDVYDGVERGFGFELNAGYRLGQRWYVGVGARRAHHGVSSGSVRFTGGYLSSRWYNAERTVLGLVGGVHTFVGLRAGYVRSEGVEGASQPVRDGLETALLVGWDVKLTRHLAIEWALSTMLQMSEGSVGGQSSLQLGLAIGSWRPAPPATEGEGG